MASPIIFSELNSLWAGRSRSVPLLILCLHLSAHCILESLMKILSSASVWRPCWKTILHGSLTFLHILWAETLAAFVLNYLSKDLCVAKIEYLPLEQRTDLFTISTSKSQAGSLPIVKGSCSLSLRFSCNTTHCMCRYHLVPFASPCQNTQTCHLLCMSNKVFCL